MTAQTEYVAIDGDGHVIEPDEFFDDYLSAEMRARMPGCRPNAEGKRRFFIDGEEHPPFPPEISIRKSMKAEDRIKVIDKERIWSAVLFPTAVLAAASIDAPLAEATARAFSRYMHDYVAPFKERLHFVAPVAGYDVASACKLAVDGVELGACGVVIRPNPVEHRPWDDPAYDHLYATVQDLDVPLIFHDATGDPNTAGGERYGMRSTQRYAFNHVISHSFEQMFASLAVLCGGVLERFPRLRVGFFEAGCSWLPYWLARLDGHHEHRIMGRYMSVALKPSEYFKRQCYVTVEPADETLPLAIAGTGSGNILFATDYPHFDSDSGATRTFEHLEGVSAADRRKIFCENAAAMYRIAMPALAAS